MLRAVTWQLSRRKTVNPVGTGQPTFPNVVIGAWRGSWCPSTAFVAEFGGGAPLVGVDIFAFLPAHAGATLFEGDVLLRLEDATRWEVAKVGAFPSRTVAMCKRATEKKPAGG